MLNCATKIRCTVYTFCICCMVELFFSLKFPVNNHFLYMAFQRTLFFSVLHIAVNSCCISFTCISNIADSFTTLMNIICKSIQFCFFFSPLHCFLCSFVVGFIPRCLFVRYCCWWCWCWWSGANPCLLSLLLLVLVSFKFKRLSWQAPRSLFFYP